MASTAVLQQEWQQLIKRLCAAASARHPAQPTWPVRLDHCFGRIVLDNVVGVDRPWREKLASPAVRNMNTQQLEDCIRMAKAILDGSTDLLALNRQSLQLRGKEKHSQGRAKDTKGKANPRVSGANKKAEPKDLPASRERYKQTTLRCSSRSSASRKSNATDRQEETKEVYKKEEA
ncbi:hypothetical protein NliqN6_1825 [Naganishia liquefaciens]|uniref:Uncharacterized protein n=1 Tax=Naganishia liquefaciens TaxID=104408 RepID=A0A8H3TQR5_9TREE|nr:hypothetical protein NliqN6_1825 [Naganishia liquefaciens]